MRSLLTILSLLLLLSSSPLPGKIQDDEARKKRREITKLSRFGRDLEEAGRFKDALTIWKQLDEISPNDFNAYEGTKRCLIGMERYDDALEHIEKTLAEVRKGGTRLNASMLSADRVDVLFSAGREDAALIEAETLLHEYRGRPDIYDDISRIYATYKQSDRVVETLLRGRDEVGDPGLFARDLAGWYQARMDWESAVAEYLLYMKESRGRDAYVTGALADLPAHLGADSVAREVIAHAIDTTKGEFQLKLRDLLASLYFSARIYDKALEQYKALDQAGEEAGGELLKFATQLQDEHEYRLAWEAYNELLSKSLGSSLKGKTLLGKAACAVGLGEIDSAKVALNGLLQPGPDAQSVIEAYAELGRIALEFDNDPARSSNYLEQAVSLSAKLNQDPLRLEELRVMAAFVKARTGDFKGAEKDLIIMVRRQNSRSSAMAQARSLLAQFAYQQGDFATTDQRVNELMTSDPSSDYANDALALKALLTDLKKSDQLPKLAEADRLVFLRDFDAAFALLDSLTTGSNPRLREEAHWLEYETNLILNDFTMALASLNSIIALENSALRADLALMKSAELCAGKLADHEKAAEYYERILIDYPNSPLADSARRKLLALEATS